MIEKYLDPKLPNVEKMVAVMALSLPDDKRKLVEAIKRTGQIVAATGDGSNDAP